MGDKKRKREEAAGADQQKPKRVKNKEKYLPKGNKGRKRAATQLMNGANAIPVQERIRNVPDDAAAAEEGAPAAAKSKPTTGDDFFMIDTTPMNAAEVEEKKKSTGLIKRERQPAKEAEHHTPKWLADKESRKEKQGKEARERKERNDKKKAPKGQEKRDMKQQEESRKRKERESKIDDAEEKEKEEETSTSEKPAAKEAKQEEQATNKNRFIVFVGNLPYTATNDSVTEHFSKISPISVRVATDKKDSDKCRGFGFVEFEAFDRMQTCLKLYHHSSFDDGKSPARKINVELTAGGGGKSATRRTKLKEKNQKLAEERAKNAQDEKKKKSEKEPEEGAEFSGIHPSRLNQMR